MREEDDELEALLTDAKSLYLGIDRDDLERSFEAFVRAAWDLVEPGVKLLWNWHLEELCRFLEDVYYGRVKRAIINVPPGSMKSLVTNVFFPVWVWAKDSRKRFLLASYDSALTIRDSVKARTIITSPWFQERWPRVEMVEDQNTKTRYNTKQHGWRIATSVKGIGTGEHPDFILIDDPTNDQQAQSDAERTFVNNWFDGTISTRLGRNPAIVIIMQRLHEDDLSGHLLKRAGWTHICWPMYYEPSREPGPGDPGHTADPRDHRTEEGDVLHPGVFTEAKLADLKENLDEYQLAGQLQQRPVPFGGGLFRREWFDTFYDSAPRLMRVVRGWDIASTEIGSKNRDPDFTVGCKIGEIFTRKVEDGREIIETTDRFVVLDVVRARSGPAGVDAMMLAAAQADGPEVAQREETEGGASGKTVIEARRRLLSKFDYDGVSVSGRSKTLRSKPFRSKCQAGRVGLMRADWNEDFLKELAAFPSSRHDDQVDAASTAFNCVLLAEKPEDTIDSLTW